MDARVLDKFVRVCLCYNIIVDDRSVAHSEYIPMNKQINKNRWTELEKGSIDEAKLTSYTASSHKTIIMTVV